MSPVFCKTRVFPADDEVLCYLGVLGRDKSVSAGLWIRKLVGPDDPGVRPFEDANDNALALAHDFLSPGRR